MDIDEVSINNPESLKYLASDVISVEGNNLLHQIVLNDSLLKNSVGKKCLNGVFKSFPSSTVNELNGDGYSALYLAVLKENLLMVKMLLTYLRDIDINAKCYPFEGEENTALHLASKLGKVSIIEELLNKGGDVNVENRCRQTPLHLAIVSDNLAAVKCLVNKGAKVYSEDEDWLTPLDYAAKYDSREILKWLMQRDYYKYPKRCSLSERFDSAMCEAVSCGNSVIVEMLADEGASVNSDLLYEAVKSGDFKTIEYIVRNGADVNNVRMNSKTLLRIAVVSCDLATFKFLFDKSNHVIKNDPTLLHKAAGSGSLAKVALLVNKNTDVNNKDKFGCAPLHYATQSGNLEIVKFLVDKNAIVNYADVEGKTILHVAAESGNLNVINLLLSRGAVMNDENKDVPMLCCAARSGVLATVELILDKFPDVNVKDKQGDTPIYYAVLEDRAEVIKALVDRGAIGNPLHVAAIHTKVTAAQTLLERGLEVNAKDEYGLTPLIYALEAVELDTDILNLLIKWGADVNFKCPNGNTPLHCACKWPSLDLNILNLLLEGNADVCATNNSGCTPLHCAARSNNVVALIYLVKKGADPNHEDVDGNTPLHYASIYGHARFVQRLLKMRAKVDVKGLHGRTPLHLATISFEKDVVQALIQRGASVKAVDEYGKTPLHYAEQTSEGSYWIRWNFKGSQ